MMTPIRSSLTACFLTVMVLVAAPAQAQLPAVPTNVTASDGLYAGWVRVDWDTINVTGTHSLWRSNSATGTYTQVGSYVVHPQTWATDTTATPGQTYYYKVKSCIDITCSALSSYDSGWRGYLNIVNTINASDSTNSEGVFVIFSSVTNTDYYQVWRAASVGGDRTLVGEPTSTVFLDDQVSPASAFYYWVVACNNTDINECGEAYKYDQGRRLWPVVENVVASDGGHAGFVRVTWDAVSGATGYRVYYSTTGGAAYLGYQQVGDTTSYDYVPPLAKPGREYAFAVTPCFGGSCGSTKSAPDAGWLDFPAPSNVSASEDVLIYTRVTWDEVDDQAFYYVYRDETNAPDGKELADFNGGSETYQDYYFDGALPGVHYTYWVIACPDTASNAFDRGCSDYSASDTGYHLPKRVDPLTASDGTSKSFIQVDWAIVDGSSTYVVERTEDPFAGQPVWAVVATVGTNSFQDTSALEGARYWYAARACGADYCGEESAFDLGYLQGTCYELTVNKVGQGSIITTPGSSVGCESGFFIAGESIQLTAEADPGWVLTGWSGTDDDAHTGWANSYTMGTAPHTITVQFSSAGDAIFADGFESE
jgi:hypothetical protein